MAKKTKTTNITKKVVRRRRRRKTNTEYAVDRAYHTIHNEILQHGRREAVRTLLRLAPKLSRRDAQYIVGRIANGMHVGASTVKLVLFVRYWWGSENDVVRVVNRKLGKGLSYDMRVGE